TTGKQIWDAKYAPLGAINYGIGGDRTEHVIWRIDNGELDGLRPQLVVVYIGSNNLPTHSNNSEIVRGVDTVITKIHEKVPSANILLVGFFPRGDMNPVSDLLRRVISISDTLEPMPCSPSLDRINEELYMGDKLHLNLDGSNLAQNPWTPQIRNEQWWLDRHQQILNSTASLGSQIKIVFIGSSLVENWANEGRPVWEANYAPLGAINYGPWRDRTEHVLWRIANGELDGLTPKVVVVYIGSNNVPVNTVDDIVRA
ncbi:Platelet-activating factor acetylhydrolase IB subunit gamma, partial [Orchesella cincta]